MKRIKVGWICHFSNNEIRGELPLSDRRIVNTIKCFLGGKKREQGGSPAVGPSGFSPAFFAIRTSLTNSKTDWLQGQPAAAAVFGELKAMATSGCRLLGGDGTGGCGTPQALVG